MNIGIYALYWWEQDIVYVGKSKDLNLRKYEHLRLMQTGKHTKKVQSAFDLYGLPDFITVQLCDIAQLDELEVFWIQELDALGLSGLNKCPGGQDVGRDTTHSASKFSHHQILQVVDLLIQGVQYKDIVDITGVSKPVVSTILNQSKHTWIPAELKTALDIEKSRRMLLPALDSSTKNYFIKSPNGRIYKVDNISEFARNHNLLGTKLNEVLREKRNQHCGWTRPTEKDLLNVVN